MKTIHASYKQFHSAKPQCQHWCQQKYSILDSILFSNNFNFYQKEKKTRVTVTSLLYLKSFKTNWYFCLLYEYVICIHMYTPTCGHVPGPSPTRICRIKAITHCPTPPPLGMDIIGPPMSWPCVFCWFHWFTLYDLTPTNSPLTHFLGMDIIGPPMSWPCVFCWFHWSTLYDLTPTNFLLTHFLTPIKSSQNSPKRALHSGLPGLRRCSDSEKYHYPFWGSV